MDLYKLKKYFYSLITYVLFTTVCAYAQIVAEPDCPTAYPICDASQSYYFEVSGPGIIDDAYGALALSCQNQTSASQWESKSAWFTFIPKHTGELGFIIAPEVEEDWEFIFFGNNPDCTDLQNIIYYQECNTETPGNSMNALTGLGDHPIQGGGGGGGIDGFDQYINVNAGEKYVLFITPFVFDGLPTKRATLTFQGNLIDVHGSDAFEQTPCVLSTDEFNLSNTISVFPNPIKDQLIITSKTNFTQLELYSITGQKVISKAFTNTLNTSSLAKGVYFLKLYAKDGGLAVKKLVKQ